MVSLRVIENEHFIQLFTELNITDLGLEVISCRSLSRKLNSLFLDNENKIKESVSQIKFLCTTANTWSGRRKSFLGVTCTHNPY